MRWPLWLRATHWDLAAGACGLGQPKARKVLVAVADGRVPAFDMVGRDSLAVTDLAGWGRDGAAVLTRYGLFLWQR